MADRPIIFSAPMIKALLAGRKTQTRRVLGLRGRYNIFEPGMWSDSYVLDPGNAEWRERYRPYATGDRLYVREAHALVPASAYRMSEGVEQAVNPDNPDQAAIYRAGFDRSTSGIRWRPSIHMPRWASRLTLIVSQVRVERLQDISLGDCWAEGCLTGKAEYRKGVLPVGWKGPFQEFKELWNSIHGDGAWDANPWVCAVSFTDVHQNIDRIPT